MARDVESERARRQLRLRIGRLRRRIDGRAHALKKEGRRLTSWRTYVTQYPAYAILAALGVGLTASAGLTSGAWTRWLGLHLFRRAANSTADALVGELRALWDESAPGEHDTRCDGADHGGT